MFLLSDYKYDLPKERIAQRPLTCRDRSKLLILNRKNGNICHSYFKEIYDQLCPSDLLIINDTKVIPARLFGNKESGGKVEILLLDYINDLILKNSDGSFECRCLIKASKRPKSDSWLNFHHGLKAKVLDFQDGVYKVRFFSDQDFDSILHKIGKMPLPPYIERNQRQEDNDNDKISYQTVYAKNQGAIAAPTAGLHFSDDLLSKLISKGIEIVKITLHVGYGTFLPVRVTDIREHKMHSEWYSISQKAASAINRAKKEGNRIIAVGTTSVRTLEYASDDNGMIKPQSGECDLFIYPGYKFKIVDSIITNFHLPESTLLMLISAFAGKDNVLNAYQIAIKEQYRFYSYGDAMFIQ